MSDAATIAAAQAAPPAPKEESGAKLIGSLLAACLGSGVLLVSVFAATKPLIEANRAAALQAAVLRVVPGAKDTRGYLLENGSLQPLPADGKAGDRPVAWAALDADGALVGYALPAEGAGFMDTIKLIHGYDPKTRHIIGMEVLESRETPGLGDKILFDPHFLSNFKSLHTDPDLKPVKRGAKTQPHEVDCITGATISSKAVVKILQASTTRWRDALSKGRP